MLLVPVFSLQHTPVTSNSSRLLSDSPGVVSTPGFSFSANPVTVTVGQTQTEQVTVTSISGFHGDVYMIAESSLILASLSPTKVTLMSGGTAIAILSVTVPNNAAPGSFYFIEIAGTAGCTNFNSALVDVTVIGPDFTINSNKNQMTVQPGNSASATISLTSKYNLAATVSLSTSAIPPGPVATLGQASVTLSSGGSAASSLTVNVPSAMNPGNYTIAVDGRVGFFLNHALYILLVVPGPTFDLLATPDHLTLQAGGASNSSTIAITPAGNFAGVVGLVNTSFTPSLTSILGSPSLTVSSPSTTLTVTAPPGTTPGDYSIFISASSGTINQIVIVDIHVKTPDFILEANPNFVTIVSGSCPSTITAAGVDGFSGTILLTSKGPSPGPTVSLSTPTVSVPGPSSSTLTITAPNNTPPGFYRLDVNGTSLSPAIFHQAEIDVAVVGPDFTLSSTPGSISTTAGQTGTSTIGTSGLFGLPTTSTISLTTSSDDPDVSPTLTTGMVAVGSTTTLSVSVASTHLTGYASINVTGTSGSLRHSIFVGIIIAGPGLSLSSSPTAISSTERVSQTSTIMATGLNGFTGKVSLNAFTSPNLNATVLPANVNAPGQATLSVNSTIPGTYTVNISGNATIGGNEIFNYTTVTVTILGPDFSLLANQLSLTVVAGSSNSAIISLHPSYGFNSQVQLTSTGSIGITPTLAPPSIGLSQNSVLTVSVDPFTNSGPYIVDVQGTSGSLVHDVMITINVASFTISANPNSLTIVNGTYETSSIQITGQNGFIAPVDLTAAVPSGIVASFTPLFIMGTGTSMLTLSVLNAVPGTYLVNVTGKSGLLSHNATITVAVPKPNFTIDPLTRVIVDCSPNSSCPQQITVTSQNGFHAQILLTISSSTPTGLACSPLSPIDGSGSDSLSCGSSSTADYNVTVTGTSGTLSHTTSVITYHVSLQPDFSIASSTNAVGPLSANSSDSTVTITISQLNGFTGIVALTATPSQGLTATLDKYSVQGHGTAQLALSAPSSGNYTVTVAGTSGTLSHSASTITVVVVDFAISATQPSAADAGTSLSSTITVSRLNHFAGTVSLTPGASSSLNCQSINPGSITGFGTAALSCTANSAGTFSETITATSGSLVHSVKISFNFEDFTIASTSPSKTGTNQQSVSTITLTGQNGFSGTTDLTVQQPTGLTCNSLSSTTVTGTGSTTVSCTSSAAGSYTLNVTGTSGLLTHKTSAIFAFASPDFSLATKETSLSFNNGTSASTTIIIGPQYGFSGTVNLSVSAPNGLTCSLSATSIQPSSTSSLSCAGNNPGDYTVRLTAQSESLSHSTNLNVHVASVAHVPPAPASSNGTILYVIIAVVVIAVVGAVFALTRARRTKG